MVLGQRAGEERVGLGLDVVGMARRRLAFGHDPFALVDLRKDVVGGGVRRRLDVELRGALVELVEVVMIAEQRPPLRVLMLLPRQRRRLVAIAEDTLAAQAAVDRVEQVVNHRAGAEKTSFLRSFPRMIV